MAMIGGEGLWCGASLRPWQILHSRLAEMHTCERLELDVWALIDETVEAAAAYTREYKTEELHFLDADDGELWRHGGLMEARIRDWLLSKVEQEDSSMNMHTYLLEYNSSFPSTFSSELNRSAPATFSSEFCDTRTEYSTLVEDHVYIEENEIDDYSYNIGSNIAGAAVSAAPLETETHFDKFSDDLRRCTKEADDLQCCTNEEDDELCAVCLEKLYFGNEEMKEFLSSITRLRCHHSFHRHCLAPWRSASSVCPCCRAPIDDDLSYSLDLEGEPDGGGLYSDSSSGCSDRVQLEMMGLLAEMEAALDRFGLLS